MQQFMRYKIPKGGKVNVDKMDVILIEATQTTRLYNTRQYKPVIFYGKQNTYHSRHKIPYL